jgi:hypothetical protein
MIPVVRTWVRKKIVTEGVELEGQYFLDIRVRCRLYLHRQKQYPSAPSEAWRIKIGCETSLTKLAYHQTGFFMYTGTRMSEP